MATEIELKAHVNDSEELRITLSGKAEFLHSFEKKDCYWFAEKSGLPSSGFRIRSEKRSFPDGKEVSLCFATYKNKEVRDGIEINDEREFSVEPAVEFEEFISKLGLKPARSKEKRGWAYSKNGITAELVEVKGLGWFIEMEIISHTANAETFAAGKKRLLDFLAEIGVANDAIESRFYSEMLNEAANERLQA